MCCIRKFDSAAEAQQFVEKLDAAFPELRLPVLADKSAGAWRGRISIGSTFGGGAVVSTLVFGDYDTDPIVRKLSRVGDPAGTIGSNEDLRDLTLIIFGGKVDVDVSATVASDWPIIAGVCLIGGNQAWFSRLAVGGLAGVVSDGAAAAVDRFQRAPAVVEKFSQPFVLRPLQNGDDGALALRLDSALGGALSYRLELDVLALRNS